MNTLPRTLIARVETEQYDLAIAADALADAAPIVKQMNHDLDRGARIGTTFCPDPDAIQRCQMVADRLLTALEQDNEAMASLMAAYILTTLDDVSAVDINLSGEANETMFFDAAGNPILPQTA